MSSIYFHYISDVKKPRIYAAFRGSVFFCPILFVLLLFKALNIAMRHEE